MGIDKILMDFLLKIFKSPALAEIFVAAIPIVEARLAIPLGMSEGVDLHPFFAFLYGYIGSSMVVPIILLLLMPLVRWMSKTKLFGKIADYFLTSFSKQADKMNKKTEADVAEPTSDEILTDEQKAEIERKIVKKRNLKKAFSIFLFVAIPLPFTGVWTGSGIAAVIKLPFHMALISILLGNLIAATFITLATIFFKDYINIIVLVVLILAVITIILLIAKMLLFKRKKPEAQN